jgi:hypothetical protein
MSSQDFRSLFNNPAFSHWYRKELLAKDPSNTSFIGVGRSESKSFVQKSVGDFILSKEQLTDIFGNSVATKLVNNAKNNVIELFDVVSYRNVAGQEQLVFPDIKFANATSEISRLLTVIGNDIDKNKIIGSLTSYFENNPQDVGHIFGFANTLLARSKESARKDLIAAAQRELKSAQNIGVPAGIKEAELYLENTKKQLDALDAFIDSMIDVLEEYDIASSKIKGLDLSINAKYRKTTTNWAFTWEASAEQQEVGRRLATVLGTIKQTKIGGKGVRGLFATLFSKPKDSLVKEVLKNFIQEFIDKSIAAPDNSKLAILQQKGSPSLVELLEDSIVSTLTGRSKKLINSYSGNTNLKPVPLLQIKNSDSVKSTILGLKAQKSKVKNTKTRVVTEKNKLKTIKISTVPTDLISITNLINAGLYEQIKKNMGSGNRTDVLNYRTGRFAKSARAERISESRQGMITVFYSYMKNPYATFSQGGRQQFPRSRDPKLLISKSIREIAQNLVTNRLRAVNV